MVATDVILGYRTRRLEDLELIPSMPCPLSRGIVFRMLLIIVNSTLSQHSVHELTELSSRPSIHTRANPPPVRFDTWHSKPRARLFSASYQ